tara:strand:+ start:389 stop:730 length:342 start_codon:yes stop_codon:yes gene_type:complete
MQPSRILKYILDMESIIHEIEEVKASVDNNFEAFRKDMMATRAIERQLEIIGEASTKILQIDPSVKITGIKSIISLRNYIIHAYDSVDLEILWGIIQKDIPVLKEELINMKSK